MPFGSVFRKLKYIELTTADGQHIKVNNNILTRITFMLIGVPHIGNRLRSRLIMKNLPKGKIHKLLDAGFGTGIYSFSLSRKVEKITAVDIEKDKLEYVTSVNPFNNIEFQIGNLCKLNFKDNSFDLIVCSDVLEHIRDDKKAFSEIARVLKKGGTLLLTVPSDSANNRENYKKYNHQRPGYTFEDINKLCKKNNLTIVSSKKYVNPFTEKLFIINEKIFSNKPLLGLLFYPLYLLSLISEVILSDSDSNGIFFKIKK